MAIVTLGALTFGASRGSAGESEVLRVMGGSWPAQRRDSGRLAKRIGGRRELINDEELFLIENLQAIALERTSTAREAIRFIGELVKEYGYGDGGECLTFADSKDEMGWWDPAGGEEFRWWKAYSGRQPYAVLKFWVLSTLAPSLGLTMDMEELLPHRRGVLVDPQDEPAVPDQVVGAGGLLLGVLREGVAARGSLPPVGATWRTRV